MEGSKELYQRKNRLVLRSAGRIGSFLPAQDAEGGGDVSHSLGLTVTGSWGHLAYCHWLFYLGSSALWGRGEWEGT